MRAVVSRGINDVEEYTPAAYCEDADDVLKDLDRLEEKYDRTTSRLRPSHAPYYAASRRPSGP